jgi:hypothetical protein
MAQIILFISLSLSLVAAPCETKETGRSSVAYRSAEAEGTPIERRKQGCPVQGETSEGR